MIELTTSKLTDLGTNAEGRKRWALDASIAAIQFRENGGVWQDIDPAIEAPDTGDFAVKFTQVPYLGRIGNNSHRRIYPDRTDLSYWIQFEKPFASMPAPTRQDRWFYWNFSHALMGIRFDNTSIKFGFRLKDSASPTSITIPFTTQGITRNGRFLYHDGELIAELKKPFAEDANKQSRDCEITFATGEVTISLDTTGLTFPIDIDPTLDLQVGASTDDAHRRLQTITDFSLTKISLQAGYFKFNGYEYGGGMRFLAVTIPQGATIDTAYLTLRCDTSYAGTVVRTRISAEDIDDAPTFADDAAAFDTRWAARTTAKVDWDSIPAWTLNSDYNSPEIKTVIQEIVDRVGWGSGNDIVIFREDFEDRSSHVNDALRTAYSYDGSSTYAPKLHVEYTAPVSGGSPGEPMAAKMIAGKLI